MKIFRNFLILLWRSWFYILTLSLILILLPVILIVIAREKWYPAFYSLARFWATVILYGMGFRPKIKYDEKIQKGESYVFAPNHTSIIDIMLMLYLSKNPFVFLGKQELANIPIFGFIYKRTCILVDRNNRKSKSNAFNEAKKRLEKGLSVCIFPEGKVPDDERVVLDEFKTGAFRLAIMFQIPLVPVSFYDCKEHFSFTFFSGGPGVLRAHVHPFIRTKGMDLSDMHRLKEKTYQILYNDLVSDLKQRNKL